MYSLITQSLNSVEAKKTEANNIASWLESLAGVTCIRPLCATIITQPYAAARYIQIHHKSHIGRSARSEEERIYIAGSLPSIRLNRRCVFRLPGTETEWYIISHYPEIVGRKQAAVPPTDNHPFGAHFILAPWPILDAPIDQWERTPYVRVPLQIQYL